MKTLKNHNPDEAIKCPKCGQKLKALTNVDMRDGKTIGISIIGYYPCICTEIVYDSADDIKNGKQPANLQSNID